MKRRGSIPLHALSLGAHAEGAVVRMPRHAWLGLGVLVAAMLRRLARLARRPARVELCRARFSCSPGSPCSRPSRPGPSASLAAPARRAGVVWHLAADHLRQSIHRNAVTVAALAAAIAMTIGLMVMIFSFRDERGRLDPSRHRRRSLHRARLQRNHRSGSRRAARRHRVAARTAGSPRRRYLPRIGVHFCSNVCTRANAARLAVIQGEYRHNLTFLGGDDERKMARVFHERCVAVTEPFARKFGVRDGDHLHLLTPRGPADFEVAGIYSDYTRDQGVMLMARENFDHWWSDPRVQSLAIYLQPGAAAEPLADAFRQRFSRAGEFAIYSNRGLRQRILSIFDQTFAVTYVLRTVAILVASPGSSFRSRRSPQSASARSASFAQSAPRAGRCSVCS